jgi:quercetin dioxygenase-like cupin family protein
VIFSTAPAGLEKVATGLEMGVTLGESFSVAVMRFLNLGSPGENVQARPHSHGEEVSLVLKGGATVQTAAGDVVVKEGDVLLMPAGLPHGGFNHFPADGDCVRLNFVTPPRPEYVAAGGRAYYPSGRSVRPAEAHVASAAASLAVRRITMGDDLMDEVIAGSLYRKHLYGDAVSIAVLKSLERGAHGKSTNAAGHQHGEEVVYFLKGGCALEIEGETYEIVEGQGIVIPAGFRHGGGRSQFLYNRGECVRVAVATPLRRDYGPDLVARGLVN